MRLILISLLLLAAVSNVFGQDEVWFEPNRGQWDSKILYKVGLQRGNFFIEQDKFTYALNDLGDVHHAAHQGQEVEEIRNHTVHSHFINSSWEGKVIEADTSEFYKNYFLGKDQSKWQAEVYSFQFLRFVDFYPGIDMILETSPTAIKYSFEVEAGVNPSIIQIYHEGMEGLEVSDQEVEIKTRFGSIIEKELKVWNETSVREIAAVQSVFMESNDTVRFHFPNGYDSTSTLIIDPSLTFSTFTGSTSDNWGFTAAPDDDANLYAGGIVFGTGYPTSTGAYDASFNGGYGSYEIDIGISKFSSDGSNLMYSTYLGGSGNETPNSIITNSQGELYILGSSTSNDYPTTSNAYETVYKGGTLTIQIAISFDGTDLIVSKLSSDGTALLSSTFLGGSSNDGMNVSSLNYNYGDAFRGEIILDQNEDVVLTSTTQSADFPIINGSNTTLGGSNDAVVVKMTPNLSNIIWSTFVGGSGSDAGYAVKANSNNNIYVSGGTKSTGFIPSGGHHSSYGGGTDGYVVQLDGVTSNVISGTYIGTGAYDQSFFVEVDQMDRVYVFGQSAGVMPVSSGVYANPNSGQFIQQYSTDLSILNWSTVVGGGNGTVEISPTAFLVSNCNKIYYTGWGGQTNHIIQATGSTSQGFPTTANAYQSNTNGNNFYIGVLTENALALDYGTFMGGVNSSTNHVDGGTSRFDKQGRIYHAVCGACGGNPNGFTTTPGAYSETNNSSNCNLAAWKFDLGALFSAMTTPDSVLCLSDTVFFNNNSQNGDEYFWDFDDGSTSTAYEPKHVYTSPGIYEVMLVVSDSEGCFDADTSYLTLEILDFNGSVVQPPDKICPGDSIQLEASGGANYEWSPAQYIDDPTIANPTASVDTTTVFTVIISDTCGADTLTITIETYINTGNTIDDLELCRGDSIKLWANGGVDYQWTSSDPSSILSNPNLDSLLVAPTTNSIYFVDIYTVDGCTLTKQVDIEVFQGPPEPVVDDTIHLCEGEEIQITVSYAPTIEWSPNIDINTTSGQTVTISTPVDRWYYIEFSNICGTVIDSVFVDVIGTFPAAGNDTIVCPGETVYLWASGGETYEWTPAGSVSAPNSPTTTATPNSSTTYTVYIIDEYGCGSSASVEVDHYPEPYVQANADYYGFVGDEVQLNANGSSVGGSYTWSPGTYLSCTVCKNPKATPKESITYFVEFEDENGCIATDEISIKYEGLIYVPNSFTPDDDGINDVFYVLGGNIEEFHLQVFDRWGELIFESFDINGVWDGTYGNRVCQDGTYVWKITYEDVEGNKQELTGHVNLLK